MRKMLLVFALCLTASAQVFPPANAGGTLPATTSALRGDGAGNASAVTGAGSNCVLVDGTSASCSGVAGASTALDNLASVSINTSLLAQTGVDVGSTTKPVRNIFLWGNGTYGSTYIELTGTPTGNRVVTIQDETQTLVGRDTTDTLTNKTLTLPTISATGFTNANHAHAAANSGGTLDAAAIAAGTMATARLGSGTANSSTFLRGDQTWATPAGSGDVVGPASATDAAVALFDGTTGKLLKNSPVTIDATAGRAGGINMPQGTAATPGTTSVLVQAPAAVTSYNILLPASVGATGVLKASVASTTATTSFGQIVASEITNATITGTQIASSIALAGSPTTTTQSALDNSTKIATTAYVDTAGKRARSLNFIFDGGGSAVTTGNTVAQTIPFACTISAYNISADAGTATFKLWKIATGTAIPTVSNSINTSGISLSSGTSVHSTTVTDFTTTAVAANDIVIGQLTAVATATWVSVGIQCDAN